MKFLTIFFILFSLISLLFLQLNAQSAEDMKKDEIACHKFLTGENSPSASVSTRNFSEDEDAEYSCIVTTHNDHLTNEIKSYIFNSLADLAQYHVSNYGKLNNKSKNYPEGFNSLSDEEKAEIQKQVDAEAPAVLRTFPIFFFYSSAAELLNNFENNFNAGLWAHHPTVARPSESLFFLNRLFDPKTGINLEEAKPAEHYTARKIFIKNSLIEKNFYNSFYHLIFLLQNFPLDFNALNAIESFVKINSVYLNDDNLHDIKIVTQKIIDLVKLIEETIKENVQLDKISDASSTPAVTYSYADLVAENSESIKKNLELNQPFFVSSADLSQIFESENVSKWFDKDHANNFLNQLQEIKKKNTRLSNKVAFSEDTFDVLKGNIQTNPIEINLPCEFTGNEAEELKQLMESDQEENEIKKQIVKKYKLCNENLGNSLFNRVSQIDLDTFFNSPISETVSQFLHLNYDPKSNYSIFSSLSYLKDDLKLNSENSLVQNLLNKKEIESYNLRSLHYNTKINKELELNSEDSLFINLQSKFKLSLYSPSTIVKNLLQDKEFNTIAPLINLNDFNSVKVFNPNVFQTYIATLLTKNKVDQQEFFESDKYIVEENRDALLTILSVRNIYENNDDHLIKNSNEFIQKYPADSTHIIEKNTVFYIPENYYYKIDLLDESEQAEDAPKFLTFLSISLTDKEQTKPNAILDNLEFYTKLAKKLIKSDSVDFDIFTPKEKTPSPHSEL